MVPFHPEGVDVLGEAEAWAGLMKLLSAQARETRQE